jgi:Bifunctional DNA primase/polymerase, N-terminal
VTLLEFALDAARRGAHVFPLRGKLPALRTSWPGIATTNAADVAAWFDGSEAYTGYGVHCGLSGLVVVDEDQHGEFQRLAAELDETIPATRTVRTGKGVHHYYRGDIAGTNLRARGFDIDVKAGVGYVVGAGSQHPNGGAYTLANDVDPVPLPQWFADYVTTHAAEGAGWTEPDLDALVQHGIPEAQTQDVVLKDVAWRLRSQRVAREAAHAVWSSIVAQTVLKKPDEPWTRADFERHWQGADHKITNDEAIEDTATRSSAP